MNADRHELERIDGRVRDLAAGAGGAPVVFLMPVTEGAVVVIAAADTSAAVAIHHLTMGSSQKPASAVLRHDPPTPSELEHAIEIIEDAVMPLARRIAAGSVLFVDAAELEVLWEPGAAADAPTTHRVSTDEVEARFTDLAAVAQGRPVASGGMPAGTDVAWTLLVVREAMHHWGFVEARIMRSQDGGPSSSSAEPR
jgi:hypothetical protein